MPEKSKYDPVLAKGYEVFTEDFTVYHSTDEFFLDRMAMAYALLYKWKRDSTVEILWETLKVRSVHLDDGYKVPVDHVVHFILFYDKREWESPMFHTKFNNRQKRAIEASALYGMLVEIMGELKATELMYEELK